MYLAPVASKERRVSEQRFHSAIVRGIDRARARFGSLTRLAHAMGVSIQQLRKIRLGAVPKPKTLFDVTLVSPCFLDDVAREYGFRLVPRECPHQTIAEDFQIALTSAGLWLAESMHSQSELGTALSRNELLAGEDRVRAIHEASGVLIDLIAQAKEHKIHSLPGHGA